MTTGVSTRLVDRRRRELAARYRRRRTVLLGAVAAGAVVAAGWWVATGPLMTVSHVSVTGYTQPDQARVVRAIQVAAHGANAVDLPTAAIDRALADAPWVSSVTVSHDRPRGLKVRIVEATPRALAVAGDGTRYLISGGGRVLAGGSAVAQEDVAALPQIHVGTVKVGEYLPAGASRAPFIVAVTVSPDVAARVRDLRVVGSVLTGRLASGPEIRFGPPTDLQRKARALDALLADRRAQEILANVKYIDVSSPKGPFADGGTDLSEASTGSQASESADPQVSSTG